jgi:2-polyprenyl-3-methyl-5-hydroxy-6-metoxy-1,4-benzoquinol methylase
VGLEPRLGLDELLGYYDSLEERRDLEAKIRARFRPRVDWVQREAGDTGRLLDIGCSRGQFPAAMKDAGWRAEGVETDAAKAAAGEAEFGIRIHNAPFDEWEGDGTYDAITGWHVVEHFVDPSKVLERAAALLEPDSGRLFLEVPNFRSLGRVLGGSQWVHYDVPYHQHFFTPATLTALCERAGLEVLWTSQRALDSDWWSVKRTLQRVLRGPLTPLRWLVSIKPIAWLVAWLGSWLGYTETFQLLARKRA